MVGYDAEEESKTMRLLERDRQERLSLCNGTQPVDMTGIRDLIFSALTDTIDDREVFMKGIDRSYHYEEDD